MNQDLQERAKQGDPEAIAIICELCQALNVLQTRVVNSINIVSYKKAHNNLKIDVFSKQEVDKQVKKDYKASEVQKRLRLSIRNSIESNTVELYNVFVPYSIAQNGGSIQVILKSGHSIDAQVPKNAQNGTQLKLKKHEFNGRTILLVLHILQAEKFNIDDKIHKIINNALIQLNTKRRCREVYFNLKEGQSVSDWDALNILDVMVESSRSKELTKNRYQIASENSRICAIQDCIDMALEASNLNEIDRKVLQAVFQFLKSGEPIYEFERLNQLDVIVRSSTLHQSLKELYAVTSTKSKALAVDSAILGLLYSACNSQDILERVKILYSQIREGNRESNPIKIKDLKALEILDAIVFQSDLPTEYKVIYLVTRIRATQSGDKEEIENIESSVDASEAVDKLREAVERASKIGSTTTTVMSSVGVKAGTGVTIASLQGAAATNATLAALGGGSVAAGGLGMLGGLTVATGGAALMGAAAFVSIAAMSNMDSRDKVNLGIAAVGGTLTSAATVGTAWTLVSTFGVAGTGTAIGTLSKILGLKPRPSRAA
ncbi:hypothetical protein POG22_03590 [Geitlerinema sp. CS-897]|nr:hypothetical protein [Geitlerinema sp. CS-897]